MEKDAPDAFLCPITRNIFEDPVMTFDGHTYERFFIEEWLKNHDTSPLSGEMLEHKELLRSNLALKHAIAEWKEDWEHKHGFRSINVNELVLSDAYPPVFDCQAFSQQLSTAPRFVEAPESLRRTCQIGVGQDKSVYRGWWLQQKEEKIVAKEVAILLFRQGNGKSTEGELFSTLGKHPNLVTFYGEAELPEGRQMLVTELAPLGCLDELLQSREQDLKASPKLRTLQLKVMQQMCAAMLCVVSKGLLHRDLAMRNVVCASLDIPHGNILVKVADFGLSVLAQYYYGTSSEIPVRWTAPEALKNRKKFSEKSDVWSFGVASWELLGRCVEMPYYREVENKAVLDGVTSGTLKLSKPEGTDEEIWSVAVTCMKMEPALRPGFSELLLQLQDLDVELRVRSRVAEELCAARGGELEELCVRLKIEGARSALAQFGVMDENRFWSLLEHDVDEMQNKNGLPPMTARQVSEILEQRRAEEAAAAQGRKLAVEQGEALVEVAHIEAVKGNRLVVSEMMKRAAVAFEMAGIENKQHAHVMLRNKVNALSARRADGERQLREARSKMSSKDVAGAAAACAAAADSFRCAEAAERLDEVRKIEQQIEDTRAWQADWAKQGEQALADARAAMQQGDLDKVERALDRARISFSVAGVLAAQQERLDKMGEALALGRRLGRPPARRGEQEQKITLEPKPAEAAHDDKAGVLARVTLDPDIPLAVTKEAWLCQQSKKLKMWKRRYFVLDNAMLYICKSPQSFPLDYFSIRQCQFHSSESTCRFDITTPSRVFRAKCPDGVIQLREWAECFGHAMSQPCHVPYFHVQTTRLDLSRELLLGVMSRGIRLVKLGLYEPGLEEEIAFFTFEELYSWGASDLETFEFRLASERAPYSFKTMHAQEIESMLELKFIRWREWRLFMQQQRRQREQRARGGGGDDSRCLSRGGRGEEARGGRGEGTHFPYFHVEQTTRLDLSRELLLGVMSRGIRLVKLGLHKPGLEEEIAFFTFEELCSWGASDLETFEFRLASERAPYSFKTMHAQEIESLAKLEVSWREWREGAGREEGTDHHQAEEMRDRRQVEGLQADIAAPSAPPLDEVEELDGWWEIPAAGGGAEAAKRSDHDSNEPPGRGQAGASMPLGDAAPKGPDKDSIPVDGAGGSAAGAGHNHRELPVDQPARTCSESAFQTH